MTSRFLASHLHPLPALNPIRASLILRKHVATAKQKECATVRLGLISAIESEKRSNLFSKNGSDRMRSEFLLLSFPALRVASLLSYELDAEPLALRIKDPGCSPGAGRCKLSAMHGLESDRRL